MSVSGELEISQRQDIEVYRLLAEEVGLGPGFIRSMECWCGLRKREQPLRYWQVYLAWLQGEPVGVSGLYQRPETPIKQVWVGWLGVRPQYRRQGLGREMVMDLARRANGMGCTQLWVFTEERIADFYRRLGFEVLGQAAVIVPGQTHDPTDLVLRLELGNW